MSNLEFTRAQRLDQRVIELVPNLSRAFVVTLVANGKVTLNGKVCYKAGQKLRPSDEVIVDYDTTQLQVVDAIDLPIVYEDADCLVIDKPSGVLTHSKGAFNPEASVASFVQTRLSGLSGNRAGIVHRLDRATSGLIICAKHAEALSWLQKQFAQRRVKKTYLAIVNGHMDPEEAIIDMPIERNPKQPQTFRVGANGKPSVTVYSVLRDSPQYSLLQLRPQTGRTHQLRVHLKYQGHPIVGDTLYGGELASRLYLHAAELELTLPNHTRQIFTSAMPQEFESYL